MNLSLIVLLSTYILNYVVNFTIINELPKWIYRSVYGIFFGRHTLS
jgi:hypothetical protein